MKRERGGRWEVKEELREGLKKQSKKKKKTKRSDEDVTSWYISRV